MKVFVVLVLLAIAGALGLAWLRRPNLAPAERGRRLAEQQGCFACHGAAGTKGASNPGRKDKTVPTFAGELMMFADDADEVREWILNGATAKKRESRTWQEQRAAGVLKMPAFRRRLNDRQVSDLVAYVMVVSDSPEPKDSLALAGRDRAKALGCTGCHGFGGRLALPNPGSLKGYVPSWDGADFPELVSGEAEFRQWVEHGVSDRFKANPAAMFFLKRARLHMPAFEHHLADGDLERLFAYVRWLRSPDARPDSAGVTAF
jgi:mono/diheme cytochrome c family protein